MQSCWIIPIVCGEFNICNILEICSTSVFWLLFFTMLVVEGTHINRFHSLLAVSRLTILTTSVTIGNPFKQSNVKEVNRSGMMKQFVQSLILKMVTGFCAFYFISYFISMDFSVFSLALLYVFIKYVPDVIYR